MKANSDKGHDLVKHSVGVMLMAMYCAQRMGVTDQDLINVIGLSAFLHDIGKCSDYFQNITLNDCLDLPEAEYLECVQRHYPDATPDSHYPRHNEISTVWALQHARSKNNLFKAIGPQAIYWHHGTTLHPSKLSHKNPRKAQMIINEINAFAAGEAAKVFDKISELVKTVTFPFNIGKYIEDEIDDSDHQIPMLYVAEKQQDDMTNAHCLIARSCVIYADYIISHNLSCADLDDLITNGSVKYFPENKTVEYRSFSCKGGYDAERFVQQQDIVNKCGRTTLVKAPAGYGKVLIGLMWGAAQGTKIYWVCPRNAVAESVYTSLLREIQEFGQTVSVELFLGSERKETNSPGIPDCQCDIVVTNIDNLLSPMVAQKAAGRLFDVNARCIVLDEFHEFVSNEALFGSFIIYMRARHIICSNSKTLLLSATPSVLHKLWDTGTNQTLVLPDEKSHYPAQHQRLYNFSFEDDFVAQPAKSSLTAYSSIRNVQKFYSKGYDQIVHSDYSEEDRKAKMALVLGTFGKEQEKKGIVVSGPILQAAMDISFRELYKAIESPESDIQTLGRVNRWGEEDVICGVHLLDLRHDKRERSAVITRYNWVLSKEWQGFLKERADCKSLTLNEVYRIYNEFQRIFGSKLIAFLRDQLAASLVKLPNFFPRQRKEYKDAKKKRIISAKTLRYSGESYFIVVPHRQTRKWCSFTFSVKDLDMPRLVDDNRHEIEDRLKTVWESLGKITDKGEAVYDYSELIHQFFGKKVTKRHTVEAILPFAKCSETPLPIFTWEYDNTLGLIKR